MTSPLPIIVDSEDRGMKRPVEEVARAICKATGVDISDLPDRSGNEFVEDQETFRIWGRAVLDRLVQLGFLNDNYFVAKKAEEAGDDVRKPQ